MKPAGVTQKTKDHSKKHPRMAEEWQKGKRIGRPAQQYNAETKQWGKILEPRKVTQ